MCVSCGCGDPEIVPVDMHESILAGNDRTASHNREHFRNGRVLAINLMGSPGAGKTAVLEATARALPSSTRIGALAGDLATDHDATRLTAAGIAAFSITTGSACHLDAAMVHRGLHHLPRHELDYLFIENVGNLVCPAVYDLGQAANVVALAVTEGEASRSSTRSCSERRTWFSSPRSICSPICQTFESRRSPTHWLASCRARCFCRFPH